jgi:hypothetical protein
MPALMEMLEDPHISLEGFEAQLSNAVRAIPMGNWAVSLKIMRSFEVFKPKCFSIGLNKALACDCSTAADSIIKRMR